jgi:hypothetical protein
MRRNVRFWSVTTPRATTSTPRCFWPSIRSGRRYLAGTHSRSAQARSAMTCWRTASRATGAAAQITAAESRPNACTRRNLLALAFGNCRWVNCLTRRAPSPRLPGKRASPRHSPRGCRRRRRREWCPSCGSAPLDDVRRRAEACTDGRECSPQIVTDHPGVYGGIAMSMVAFAPENPETGLSPPVVEKTHGPVYRGNSARIASTGSDSGTSCSRPDLFSAAGSKPHRFKQRSQSSRR